MTDVAEMTDVGEITQTVETGNAPNVTTQTLHSEPNAIDAVSQKEAVAKEETIVDNAMVTDVVGMTAEVEMIAEVEMTVAGEITQTVEIGNAPNVTTQTLHSEPNAIDAVSQKEAVAKEETIEGDAMATDVAEMTAEVEMTVAEMTDVDAEMIIAALTPIMTGIVVNVTIPTSHLEPNVIVVAPLKEEVAHHLNNGKVMTVELAKEGMPLNLELVIGIAHNVENQTSQKEMIALDVDARKELEALDLKATIEN